MGRPSVWARHKGSTSAGGCWLSALELAPPFLSLWIQGPNAAVVHLPSSLGAWCVDSGLRLSSLTEGGCSTHPQSTHLVPLTHTGCGLGSAGIHRVGVEEAHKGTRGAGADKPCPLGHTGWSLSLGGSVVPPPPRTHLPCEMPRAEDEQVDSVPTSSPGAQDPSPSGMQRS